MNLRLVPRSRDDVRSTLDAMDAASRAQISADWLAKFRDSAFQDPWVHGFQLLREDGVSVGLASFKGPPVDGLVEIAYAIVPQHQGRGYATAAARLLVEHAFACDDVSMVCAHTLPQGAASQRVLQKAGFQHVGEWVDPEDGPVWRYQISRLPSCAK
jgi:[ribosomal protein S5]-alanine N-acetyltransferase